MIFHSLARYILGNKSLKYLSKPAKRVIKSYWTWKFKGDYTARIDQLQRIYFNKPLNLTNPQTMYDKLMWMELNTDVTEWSRLADKISVRDFVCERGLGHILNEVFVVWDDMPDFETFAAALPAECVVKTSHTGGSEGVFIIRDKATANLPDIYRRLVASFNDPYGVRTKQRHYIDIKPRVLVERLMKYADRPDSAVNDYKFFCINGEPDTLCIYADRDIITHKYKLQYFDTNMRRYDWEGQNQEPQLTPPTQYKKMIEYARILAQGFPFVRIDFYEVDGKIIFGEMTFTPGFEFFIGSYADTELKWGERIDLSMA